MATMHRTAIRRPISITLLFLAVITAGFLSWAIPAMMTGRDIPTPSLPAVSSGVPQDAVQPSSDSSPERGLQQAVKQRGNKDWLTLLTPSGPVVAVNQSRGKTWLTVQTPSGPVVVEADNVIFIPGGQLVDLGYAKKIQFETQNPLSDMSRWYRNQHPEEGIPQFPGEYVAYNGTRTYLASFTTPAIEKREREHPFIPVPFPPVEPAWFEGEARLQAESFYKAVPLELFRYNGLEDSDHTANFWRMVRDPQGLLELRDHLSKTARFASRPVWEDYEFYKIETLKINRVSPSKFQITVLLAYAPREGGPADHTTTQLIFEYGHYAGEESARWSLWSMVSHQILESS